MPDVSSKQPADVRMWVSFDVHRLSIVAAALLQTGGYPELTRVAKQLLRHGLVFREGKKSWAKAHLACVRAQRLSDRSRTPRLSRC